MTTTTVAESSWDAARQLLTTRLSGEADLPVIEQWYRSLGAALAEIPDHGCFKILVDLHGFTAADLISHKAFRSMVPLTLASYGWQVGYVQLFEDEARQITYTHRRGIRCVGAAHCHHDATKITNYEARFGRAHERFFTDRAQAAAWIRHLPVAGGPDPAGPAG
ncbi:hypothetical protein [Hymenobacter sp. B81]|uniref:hypothetical protein n=1 Tax=Hymenobacter sp. B81 TaxID=3344878 RepID=UPI0037DC9FC1